MVRRPGSGRGVGAGNSGACDRGGVGRGGGVSSALRRDLEKAKGVLGTAGEGGKAPVKLLRRWKKTRKNHSRRGVGTLGLCRIWGRVDDHHRGGSVLALPGNGPVKHRPRTHLGGGGVKRGTVPRNGADTQIIR